MTRRSAKPPESEQEDPRRTAEAGRRGGVVAEPTSRESAGSNRAPDEDTEQLSLEDYNNLLEDYRRIAAEFDNYRKRQARDFNRLISQGRRQLVTELLAVLDNFDRARDTLDGKHPDSEIITGLIQIGNQIVSLLQKEGLAEVVTKEGDHFDPNIHEAMMAEDSADGTVDEVMQVLQKGYRFGQDLIRPVRVKVSRGLKREVEDAGE